MRKLRFSLAFVALLLPAIANAAVDAAQLQLALKKLTVVGSAMYVAAHPDDENTALIAFLGNERLYRTGYLAITRGDGGQNLIGDEKGELLGVIRTQELLAARRIDGGEQYFTRAIDFGYSKNPQETLAIWGHDAALSDVVYNIRRFQPDVLITRFPTTGEGGHGHHTASAILAVEAFTAAADPTKFPEQLKTVGVWQPKRIFWNRFSFQPIKPDDPSVAKSLRLDVGDYNAILGRSYTEIAAESRSQHKSQGFGSAERRGTLLNYFDQLAGDPAQKDMFEGIDTTWSRYAGAEEVGRVLQQASDTFDPKNPSNSIPLLLQAHDLLTRLGASGGAWAQSAILPVKLHDLQSAILACAGMSIDVSAGDSAVIPGGEVPVSVSVVNRSDYPFTLQMVGSLWANPSKGVSEALKNNVPVKVDISIKVPQDAEFTPPYWLRLPPTKGDYVVTDRKLIGLPEAPPAIPIVVTLADDRMHNLFVTVPAVSRWVDPVRGEQVRNVDVVPEVTANLGSSVYLFPDAQPKPVTVWLRNYDAAGPVSVRLHAPRGWATDPVSVPVIFSGKGDEAHVTFKVTPPKEEQNAQLAVEVDLVNGKKLSIGATDIQYAHIPYQRVFGDAFAKLVRANVAKRGSRVGYIMGSGDDVPDALRQIGYDVTFLTDADLERGDFAKYDAIITGVRAFNTRKRLKLIEPKLLDYVKNGGTMVVQYNTLQELVTKDIGPYPFKISNDRVTVEEAPVTFTDPASPLLNTPNKITQADFGGWVQERGLYFLRDWDPKYQTVISTNDPGETAKAGGELWTRYGKGVFVYTSYDWFRELPAGVPGAYRLFANLVSAR